MLIGNLRCAGVSEPVVRPFRASRKDQPRPPLRCIARAGRGVVDADLGGNVIKQRISRQGQGRSGGYRAVIVLRAGQRAIFLRGFAKNETDNITADELRAIKEAARDLLRLGNKELEKLARAGALTEIDCSGQVTQEQDDGGRP